MGSVPVPNHRGDIKLLNQLGRGYFGEVWECKRAVPTGNKVLDEMRFAVKRVPMAMIRDHGIMEQMEREVAILRGLDHPRIVKFHFDFRNVEHLYLGMEFAEGGVMFDRLTSQKRFSNEDAAQYFYEMCDALDYLHNLPEPVIHRDIKPENILLDREGHVKLADFGWSNTLKNSVMLGTFCGTQDYLAPEMVRNEGHNESLDMWEMGVLLYEMTSGKSPFGVNPPDQEETMRRILRVNLNFSSCIDLDAQDLVRSLCKLAPAERLTAAQAMQHRYCKRFHSPAAVCDEGCCRPSVEARRLWKAKARLDGEMMLILQAKMDTERQLLETSAESDHMHLRYQMETRQVAQGEEEHLRLKEKEERQLRELEDLRASTEALQAEVQRLRHSGS